MTPNSTRLTLQPDRIRLLRYWCRCFISLSFRTTAVSTAACEGGSDHRINSGIPISSNTPTAIRLSNRDLASISIYLPPLSAGHSSSFEIRQAIGLAPLSYPIQEVTSSDPWGKYRHRYRLFRQPFPGFLTGYLLPPGIVKGIPLSAMVTTTTPF